MNKYYRIALISFTILFMELLLVRLIGTEIRIFAYLSNLVLLAIFVGSGMGMLAKHKFSLRVSAVIFLIIFFITKLGIFGGITDLLSPLNENIIWFQQDSGSLIGVIGGLLMTTFLFFLILLSFMPLGQYLGNILNNSDQIILAYSINVIMSILGMWAFFSLSFLTIPPVGGTIVAQFILILLTEDKNHRSFMAIVLILTAIIGLSP